MLKNQVRSSKIKNSAFYYSEIRHEKKNEDIITTLSSPFISFSMSSKLVSFDIFKEIKEASDRLFNNITLECNRRIKAIKKSTADALNLISLLKNSISTLYAKGKFYMQNLNDMKEYSSKASLHYKYLCEEFNEFIDRITLIPIEALKIDQTKRLSNLDMNCISSQWGIVNLSGIKILPNWITIQIETGIRSGFSEVKIYQKSKLVSIADIQSMKYFGILNGNRLPAQDLKNLS